jgi:hypothetical protein
VNSGSATHPHLYSTRLGTVGILDLALGKLDAKIVRLGETPGRRNPGLEFSFSLLEGAVRRVQPALPLA